jgi:FKBP-type peptidyl-prolyl cis-trans isomerase FklB
MIRPFSIINIILLIITMGCATEMEPHAEDDTTPVKTPESRKQVEPKYDVIKKNKLKSTKNVLLNESGKTASGVEYKILRRGDGASPLPIDKVVCHYEGTLTDGTVFDSSYSRGNPAAFPLNQVIKGWQDVLILMKVGSKWKITIPPHLAYGQKGAGKLIGPNETLIFTIELMGIK